MGNNFTNISEPIAESESEYNKDQAASAESAARMMRLIVDNMPFGCNVLDKNYQISYCNQAAAKLHGLKNKQEFIDRFNELTPEFQPDGSRSVDVGTRHALTAFEKGSSQIEWTHNRPDGTSFAVESTLIRVKSQDGYDMINFMRDLTLEKELKAFELTQTIMDSSPLVVDIWDDTPKLISTSRQAVEMFGLSSQEEYLLRFAELSPEFQPCGTPTGEKVTTYLKQAFSEGGAKFEWMHQTLSGEPLPVEITLVRFTRQSRYFVAAYTVDLRPVKEAMERERVLEKKLLEQDLSKRAEVAEESNKAKSRFLARMSHEIRTPITAVLGISEIQLQNTALHPAQEEAFAKIHDSSNMLLGIINDILDLSKIEAEKMSLTCEEYDVASLINDAVQPHTLFLDHKDIEFLVRIDDALPVLLIGDALRIKQIMNNILSNSFKYTESGTVELHLECQRDDEEHITLVITVRDTGFGMTPEQVDTLYRQEYIRFHENEARSISGTGLGMSIVCNLVQLMDARIDVDSEVGKGTTVIVRIPQKVVGTEVLGKEIAESLQRFEMSADSASKKFKFTPEPMPYGRVLVVDDVDANLYVVEGLLSFYGLNIETCDSGYAAIEKIKQGNVYDIVFIDQMMPGINGTETMLAMRELGYEEPIIALTANALIGQVEAFILNGFDGFLSKPIHTMHLNTVLLRHIKDKQPPEVLAAAHAEGSGKPAVDIDNYQRKPELLRRLRAEFVRDQTSALTDMKQALYSDDLNTAHRLAHTLKSFAGLIHEETLAQVAGQVEDSLRDGRNPTEKQFSALESEFARVLESIGEPEPVTLSDDKVFDKDRAIALFDKLTPMLEFNSSDCLRLLPEIREIPETAVLVKQIEDFDFEPALQTVSTLRRILED